MGKKSSSNKPSKAGQATRTAANKKKHKEFMTKLYIQKHGSAEGMPDWDTKPNFTPKRQNLVLDLVQGKKELTKEQARRVREAGITWRRTR